MVFIEPSVELIEEKDPYKKIELAGRTCYKSEDKITNDSAIKFVKALIKREHYAMLEHQVFVFEILGSPNISYNKFKDYIYYLKKDKYLNVTDDIIKVGENDYQIRYLVSGNVRAICQRNVNDPLFREIYSKYSYLCFGAGLICNKIFEDCEASIVNIDDIINTMSYNEIINHVYYTFKIITDRGVTHELVRHRPCSFAQESTRYVNYKNGLSIALPSGFYDRPNEVQLVYQKAFEAANMFYHDLIEYCGQTPQQARAVLPSATKTEIVVTANFEEWIHIINLRYFGTTGAPHPDIKFVIEKVFNELKKDKLIGDLLEKEM